ncbi:hypothetical protein PInf_005541 [Phytophthora infestans]|nr:hypothetical protein PInf_005541 [Phytophthora infestans]
MECADADEGTSEGSLGLVSSAARDEPKGHSKIMKLNPGERQGWWSAKKFDRRIRMRALVQGAVNDQQTSILLDTGANVSVITDAFAKKLRLRDVPDYGRRIDIQGINEGKVSTTRRACVKITLGWEMVYEFEMWVMAHSAGVDVVLGPDFMIPAGIRLDLFHGAAQLPHEVQIPLIKTKNMIDSEEYGSHVNAGPPERLDIQAHEWQEYRLAKRQVGLEDHVRWVRRTSKLIPSVARFRRGRPQNIRLTNVSDQTVYLPAHYLIAIWISDGDLPRGDGYVRLDSKKYQAWQVLAYEGCRDRELFQRECEIYEQWLATQPSAVERPDYPEPSEVLARPLEDSLMDSSDRLTCAERWAMIMEERERVEACLSSGVTAGDTAEGQSFEEPWDTYTTAHGGDNIANGASVARTHELLSSVNVVHTPESVRFKSGVTTEATSNSTGLDGVTSFDEVVPALCAAKFANESSVVGPEDADIALKVVNTAPNVRCKIGANAELSRQRPSKVPNKGQQPNLSVARVFKMRVGILPDWDCPSPTHPFLLPSWFIRTTVYIVYHREPHNSLTGRARATSMDLRTRAAQKRPLTHSAEWESDESEGNSSDAPPADVWAPSPVVSELNTTHIPLEPVSCSDPPESTSSTSEGGSSVRVLALAPKKVEFPSWEVFEDYLAVYQAQTFQAHSAGGSEMGNQDGKEMDPVPNVELKEDGDFESREGSVATLDDTYISVARVLTTERNEATENAKNDFYEHPANNIGLEDYAKELAFLPDLTEEINTTIDYNAPNVADPQLSTDRRECLVATLKNHEHILIASGNALPPPAYGAVCDIDK